jgi:hypothetical protein
MLHPNSSSILSAEKILTKNQHFLLILRGVKMSNEKKSTKSLINKINTYLILAIIMIIFSPILAFAGTDGAELQGAYDKLVGFIAGIGGKIIALISGLFGIVGCVAKFNPPAIFTFFGVAIGVGSVGTIVDTTVTACLCF